MSRNDDAYPPAPTGYGPPSRRTLPYPDVDDSRRSDPAGRALELATSAVEAARDSAPLSEHGMHRLEEDVAEIKEVLGKPPAPGRPGSGLVGAVMEMQSAIERLEARVQVARRPVSKQFVIAAIAALTGGGGIVGIIHAWRGGEPSPAQQYQTPGRTHDAHP